MKESDERLADQEEYRLQAGRTDHPEVRDEARQALCFVLVASKYGFRSRPRNTATLLPGGYAWYNVCDRS